MRPYTNLHLHTTYCDGKDDPETMVRAAFDAGCRGIGFSAHAYFPQDDSWTLKGDEAEVAYREDVLNLRRHYGETMEIYLGLEQDVDAPLSRYHYDYVIGAAHGLDKDGEYIGVDHTPEILEDAVNDHYGGNLYALCADYYHHVQEVAQLPQLDIVAHMDLVTKFPWVRERLDQTDRRYRMAWQEVIEALLPTGALFEINTGAMTRGYHNRPYPSQEILRYLRRRGGKIIITGDTHSRDHVVTFQKEAREWAKEAGYTSHVQLMGGQWQECPL